jgi:hypothetical protein
MTPIAFTFIGIKLALWVTKGMEYTIQKQQFRIVAIKEYGVMSSVSLFLVMLNTICLQKSEYKMVSSFAHKLFI